MTRTKQTQKTKISMKQQVNSSLPITKPGLGQVRQNTTTSPQHSPQSGPQSGLFGNIMSTVAQGFSFGTGSALAHQGISRIFNSDKDTHDNQDITTDSNSSKTIENVKNVKDHELNSLCQTIIKRYLKCVETEFNSDDCHKYGQQVKQCLELS